MRLIVLFLCALTMNAMPNETSELVDLGPLLEPVLKKSKLPSIAAAVVNGDKITGVGAVGVRKIGDPTPVASADKYHIGSCTKMMTATLAAALIEQGLLTWETTIEEVLGDVVEDIHPEFKSVSLEMLLAHIGGLPARPPKKVWAKAWENQGRIAATDQRKMFITSLLAAKPAYQPGTKSIYSNQGYATVGLMLETLAEKPWEELMRIHIFEPLGMDSAGFRAPCSAFELDQPWGHKGKKPASPDRVTGDNPDAIGPAGTVHLSIEDLAKFARYHLNQPTDSILKKAESFQKLNTTLPKSAHHGVGGWLVHDLERFGGHCLQMTGSNTEWFTLFWIWPADDIAIVVSTNSSSISVFGKCDAAAAAILHEFRGR